MTKFFDSRYAALFQKQDELLAQLDRVSKEILAVCSGASTHKTLKNELASNSLRIYQPQGASGYRGVSYIKNRQRWVARIFISGRQVSLGTHATAEAAAAAYEQARLRLLQSRKAVAA